MLIREEQARIRGSTGKERQLEGKDRKREDKEREGVGVEEERYVVTRRKIRVMREEGEGCSCGASKVASLILGGFSALPVCSEGISAERCSLRRGNFHGCESDVVLASCVCGNCHNMSCLAHVAPRCPFDQVVEVMDD